MLLKSARVLVPMVAVMGVAFPTDSVWADGACCFPDGTCQLLDSADCEDMSGYPMGEGSFCLGDGNANGLDDMCEAAGACCRSDGTCDNNTFDVCSAKGGAAWRGPGSSCAGDANGNGTDDFCEPTRACCHPDGTCSQLPPEECAGKFDGEAQAPGVGCAGDGNGNGIDDICEDVQGCCLPNGSCVNTGAVDCLMQGGVPQGEGHFCATAQACCLPGGACTDIDPLCCLDQGGLPLGDGTVCGASVEACCYPDGTCENLDSSCCAVQGGVSQGMGTMCAGDVNMNGTNDACEAGVPQACCLPDGTCITVDPAICLSLMGMSQAPGSVCTMPQACCLQDGTCRDLDPLCCDEAGGVSAGPGSMCGGDEACCFPNETCRVRSAACCALQGGIPQGAGSICEPPSITCPMNQTIECNTPIDPAILGVPSAMDDCDGTLMIDFSDMVSPGNCPQEFTITRTWTATDADGNMASCVQTIVVDDSTPPMISCPSNVSVPCNSPTDPAATGTASAMDNCDLMPEVSFSDVVLPGLCPQEQTIQRTWTAVDDCGNMNACVQLITVDDNTPPAIMCPGNVTVDCEDSTDPASTGTATATDNCDSSPTVSFNDAIQPGACPQERTIQRTWTAMDDCGNSDSCVQTIQVVDDTVPQITCPADVQVQCTGPNGVPVGNVPLNASASDNCDANPNITDNRPVGFYPPTCGGAGTSVVFAAADDCGNTSMCTVEVSVVGDACCGVRGCCLPDGTCANLLPNACLLQGGTVRPVGSSCSAPRACCLSNNTCQLLDPLCCAAIGGTPGSVGSACNDDSDGDGVQDCADRCPGEDDTLDADGDGIPDCDQGGGTDVPTVSQWGLISLSLALLCLGKIYFGRRRSSIA